MVAVERQLSCRADELVGGPPPGRLCRFEQDALPALNALYALAEDYVTFLLLQPVLKLVEKTRDGPRVRRRYDTAQTPYRRLLAQSKLPTATMHRPKAAG